MRLKKIMIALEKEVVDDIYCALDVCDNNMLIDNIEMLRSGVQTNEICCVSITTHEYSIGVALYLTFNCIHQFINTGRLYPECVAHKRIYVSRVVIDGSPIEDEKFINLLETEINELFLSKTNYGVFKKRLREN